MSNRLLSKIESICGFQIKSHFPPFAFLIFLFTLTAPFVLAEKDFPEKANTLVSDFANMLSKEEHSQLERKLVAFNDSTSTQIAVVIMRSTGNYEISEYAVRLYNHWGIGQKDKNNGVLVLVAIEDRKVFINTGYGIEGVLPDALCKRIVENEIVPAFRAGMIYKGLDDATNSI
ncbi:MAG: TPM domain-containing protein, partial [Bacteroidetes bacterium]